MREKKEVRIFFALWPDDATRNQLRKTAAEIPLPACANSVPPHNLHLTLHFIGNVSVQQMRCLQQQARQVKTGIIELTIDSAGCFRQSRVAWLGCRKIPNTLTGLHQKLGHALGKFGFQPETRPYNPHVTVARKIGRLPEFASFEPIRWSVREFTLINSRSTSEGVKYEVVETFELE